MSDPLIRLSVNFIGAPALKGKDYLSYRGENKITTIFGAAIGAFVPMGQYKKNKLLNIGQNRYIIRPQLGFVHIHNAWSYELTGTLNFFTDNNDFWGNNKREQDPLAGIQMHLLHTFKNTIWGSVSTGYDYGGETKINGIRKNDKKENLFFSISTGLSINKVSTVKISYIGARTQQNTGANSDYYVLALTYRF
jgi:hypothetical protein